MILPHDDPSALLAAVLDQQPSAVLFDLDGTLSNSHGVNRTSLQQVWAAQGASLDEAWLDTRTGLSASNLAVAWNADHNGALNPDLVVADFIAESVRRIAEVPLFSDTLTVLESLPAALPLALVTNNSLAVVEALMGQHDQLQRFSVIVTADDAGLRPKPYPDPYIAAHQRLHVSAPACVAIEDSEEGLRAARSAGLNAIDVRAFR